MPEPHLDPGNRLDFGPEGAASAAVAVAVAAVPFAELGFQPVVDAGVGAVRALASAVRTPAVSLVGAVARVVGVGGRQGEPRREVPQQARLLLPLGVLVVARGAAAVPPQTRLGHDPGQRNHAWRCVVNVFTDNIFPIYFVMYMYLF